MDENKILWNELLKHRGHNVAIVSYGDYDNPTDVCLECEDCNEVILDAEIYTLCAREDDEKKSNTYILPEELSKFWDTKAICIEFSDGTDALAQENGYTLEQCLSMDDVKFFIDEKES